MTLRYVVIGLAVILGAYPLAILPAMPVAAAGGAAVVLSVAGIVLGSRAVLTAGVAVLLGEYAFALARAGGPPRLAGAVVAGVLLALLLEVGDFARRLRHVDVGRGVMASQLRYWIGFAALGAVAAFVLTGVASVIAAGVRLPWSPVIAAAGAVAALGAAVVALRRLTREALPPVGREARPPV